MSTTLYQTRVANLLFQFRIGSDANLFGRMVYGLFHLWGVTGLPPLPNPPKTLAQISRVPRGYGLDFGKVAYGMLMQKLRDKDKVEEVLSEFLTLKVMDRQHKLADKFKGLPIDDAKKIVLVALRNFMISKLRDESRQQKIEGPGSSDISETEHILNTSGGGGDLDELLTPQEIDQVVRRVQKIIAPRNPDIARDIPLYFEYLMDGHRDSEIVTKQMLPSLRERPISPQAWSKGYKEVIKKVLNDHLERNASVSEATLTRVANLVKATSTRVAREFDKRKSYQEILVTIHAQFTEACAFELFEGVKDLHNRYAELERFENVYGFKNWDIGYPRETSGVWACRVYLNSGSSIPGPKGEYLDANLDVQIKFGSKVQVTLVMGNRKTIFSRDFNPSSATPTLIGAFLTEAWKDTLGIH